MNTLLKLSSRKGHSFQFTIYFVLFVSSAFAQQSWQKTYGGTKDEYGLSAQQTLDGGYIIAGRTNSFGAGNYDVFLIRTNANGDTLWTKTYGGAGDDAGESVEQTKDGGFIVAGTTNSFSHLIQVYLIKTNSSGDTLWTKTYGGSGDEYCSSAHQTTDGGYIVTWDQSLSDLYVIKTNSSGDILWTRTYGKGGRYGTDVGPKITQTKDGGYIVEGCFYDQSTNLHSIYIIKTNANGDTLWTRTYGLEGARATFGRAIQQTADSGYIVVGSADLPIKTVIYFVKTTAIGDTLWTRTYGKTGWTYGDYIQQTTDGGYIVVGEICPHADNNFDVYLFKTNSYGDTLWTRTYGGQNMDKGHYVEQMNDGGYVIIGETYSFGNAWQMYLIKTAANGIVGVTDNKPNGDIPTLFNLWQNYPNPFNPITMIRFSLPTKSSVKLMMYDLLGREIVRLIDRDMNEGYQDVEWKASVSTGIYFYRLEATSKDDPSKRFIETKKMLLLR